MVSDGRLSLDKTISDYLPELSDRIENADKITLNLLIQHKSGIPNFTDTPNFWAKPTKNYQESLALILDQPAHFSPGEEQEYCNTNYLLINKVMDDVLQEDNFRFKQQRILAPLNLQHTIASLDQVDMGEVMSGYHVGYAEDLKSNEQGMLATAQDVGTFIRALNDGAVFDRQEAAIYASL